jgi:hypothetical protein
MLKLTAPSVSPLCIVYVALQLAFDPLTFAALPAIVTVGVAMFSLEAIVNVIISPTFAKVVALLFDAMVAVSNVGTVLSKVTALPDVTAVTAVPALPAMSLKAMLKLTAPVVSPLCMA